MERQAFTRDDVGDAEPVACDRVAVEVDVLYGQAQPHQEPAENGQRLLPHNARGALLVEEADHLDADAVPELPVPHPAVAGVRVDALEEEELDAAQRIVRSRLLPQPQAAIGDAVDAVTVGLV